jgi:glutaredoxin 3
MKPALPRLFIKPHCPWCHRAEAWFRERGIAFERLDVMADPAAFAEMERLSGQTFAPTLQVGDKLLADFGPEELEAFWKTL